LRRILIKMIGALNPAVNWNFTTVEILVQFLYVVQTTILFIFGSELAKKFIHADKKAREDPAHKIFFLISLAIIGYGLYNFIAIMNYFYPGPDWRRVLQQLAVSIIIFPFGVLADKRFIKKKLKIPFCTIIGYSIMGFLTVLTILEYLNFQIIHRQVAIMYIPSFTSYAIMGLSGIMVVLQIVLHDLKPQNEVKGFILKGTIFGFLALGTAAWGGIYNHSIEGTTNFWWVVSKLCNVISWLGFRHYFIQIPSYSQFEWKRGIFRLHIFLLHGISIYSHTFPAQEVYDSLHKDEDGRHLEDLSDLIAGGIVGIKGMLGEITGDRGKLESIKIGNKSLVFKSGEHLTGLLLCEKNFGVYYNLLSDLVKKIEEKNPNLETFNGNVSLLEIEPSFKEVFDMTLE
jgi:hypothetical protein